VLDKINFIVSKRLGPTSGWNRPSLRLGGKAHGVFVGALLYTEPTSAQPARRLNRSPLGGKEKVLLSKREVNMPHFIEPSEEKEYVILRIEGEVSATTIMPMIVEAHAMGKILGISRYLVDGIKSRNISSILENYLFAYENMKNTPGIDKNARVAILVNTDDHSHDFVETVSKNTGFDTTMFRDRNIAIEWLLNK
jgi:hypothetical protein